jgi:hypothetical protein
MSILSAHQHDALAYLAEVAHAPTKAVARWLYCDGTAPTSGQLGGARIVLGHLKDKGLVTRQRLSPVPEDLHWDITEAGAKAIGAPWPIIKVAR